jgi:hypothetical protein
MVAEHGFVTDVVGRMKQAFCGLHGHDSLLQFGHDRMYLKCTTCGHESPGWELSENPPAMTEKNPARRPALTRHLVGARRVA